MRRFAIFLGRDLLHMGRDPLQLFLLIYPWVFPLLVRWGLPPLREQYKASFDLLPYYPVVLVFLSLVIPTLLGAAQAFVFLDDQDDNTLAAVRTTPLPMWVYFGSKFFFSIGGSILVIMVSIPIADLLPVRLEMLLLIALEAALGAPVISLLIATVAANKVEGFAVMKGIGFFALIPMVAFFVPGYWNLLMGIIPGYWPAMAFYRLLGLNSGWLSFSFYFWTGLVYNAALLVFFYYRFVRKEQFA